MAEEAIKQFCRRCKERTAEILDEESFNVGEARGKLARVADFTCFDKASYKIVKSCPGWITQKELDRLLAFNGSQQSASTILQIFFWRQNDQGPFYRPKLFYNQPNQPIPDDLKKLVK